MLSLQKTLHGALCNALQRFLQAGIGEGSQRCAGVRVDKGSTVCTIEEVLYCSEQLEKMEGKWNPQTTCTA